jgi:hypothetical protein
MTDQLTAEQADRLREVRSEPEEVGLNSIQRLRLACLQIVGRLGVRCDPRVAAQDLVDYVLDGPPVVDDAPAHGDDK